MKTTLDLLSRAMLGATSGAELARSLHLDRSALAVAKTRGRLSPTVAGLLAERLGDDPKEWIAIAALEAEPAGRTRDRLLRAVVSARNS